MILAQCVVLLTCESSAFYPLHLSDSLIDEPNDISSNNSLDKFLDFDKKFQTCIFHDECYLKVAQWYLASRMSCLYSSLKIYLWKHSASSLQVFHGNYHEEM